MLEGDSFCVENMLTSSQWVVASRAQSPDVSEMEAMTLNWLTFFVWFFIVSDDDLGQWPNG